MSNVYQQYQSDVTGVANNLITQMVCADKGIDYNQLMATAQQAHLQNIMVQEQQRQFDLAVKRYYNGNNQGLLGKMKDLLVGDSSSVISNPFTPMNPMQPTIAPPSVLQPNMLANQLLSIATPIPAGADDDRFKSLETDVDSIKSMITQLSQALIKPVNV